VFRVNYVALGYGLMISNPKIVNMSDFKIHVHVHFHWNRPVDLLLHYCNICHLQQVATLEE